MWQAIFRHVPHLPCSGNLCQAFIKLESLPSIPKERREAYADLAMSIFLAHPPADPHSLAEGREQQQRRTAAGPGSSSRAQHDALLDDFMTEKDQVSTRLRRTGHDPVISLQFLT